MIRLIFHVMATLALLFCAALGAIHAQPYDDDGLAAQFSPDHCGCFLGIHPGETTRLQALLLLHTHPWVGTVTANNDGTIAWTWNGSEPAFLGGRPARLMIVDGVVRWISLPTSAQLADLAFAFGAPNAAYFFIWQVSDSSTLLLHYFEERDSYYAQQFEASTSVLCPLTPARMWALPVTITLPAPSTHSTLLYVVRDAFTPMSEVCR